ncbi:hypothetical protein BHM03_00043221, partial [Ensete ventricosum]
GNSPRVRRELAKSIGSLPGWRKGVSRKKIETLRKIIGVAERLAESWEDFAKGIGKIARNTPGDRWRMIVRLTIGNVGGCRVVRVRSSIKLSAHV